MPPPAASTVIPYALTLYQRTEIGLRIDIANGMTYYTKRLREAIEGQEKARKLVEMDDCVIDREQPLTRVLPTLVIRSRSETLHGRSGFASRRIENKEAPGFPRPPQYT